MKNSSFGMWFVQRITMISAFKFLAALILSLVLFLGYYRIAHSYGDQEAAAAEGAKAWAEQMGITAVSAQCYDTSTMGHEVDCTVSDGKQLYAVTCMVMWETCSACVLSSGRRSSSTTVVPIILPIGR